MQILLLYMKYLVPNRITNENRKKKIGNKFTVGNPLRKKNFKNYFLNNENTDTRPLNIFIVVVILSFYSD